MQAFESFRWICGGREKEGGLGGLKPGVRIVVRAYVIGREAASFVLGLSGGEAETCTTMERAVARAIEDAQPGDTVLLAPAAASFDQYDNFEQRGEDFIACVEARL